MSIQEEKNLHNQSMSDLEALRAKEELYKIENKIKLRQEFYHSKILETSTKAKTKFEAYDKYHLISEQEAMQKNLHVL